jgi:hypothetical protein
VLVHRLISNFKKVAAALEDEETPTDAATVVAQQFSELLDGGTLDHLEAALPQPLPQPLPAPEPPPQRERPRVLGTVTAGKSGRTC